MFKDPKKVFMKLEQALANYSSLHSKKEKMLHLHRNSFFFIRTFYILQVFKPNQ